MCSVLENILYALEKKVYSAAFGWNVPQISIKSIWSNGLFKACVFLIFCLDDLSIGVNRMLKSPTIMALLSISPFMAVSIFIVY